jgi:hypothetical protein
VEESLRAFFHPGFFCCLTHELTVCLSPHKSQTDGVDAPVDHALDEHTTARASAHLWQALRRRLQAGPPAKAAAPLWGVAFIATWFAMTLIYAGSMERTVGTIYNSDLLMPFMVTRDILHEPASLLDWNLSAALYAFPDWILAGALQASPLPRMVWPLAYGGFLLAAHGFCIGWMLVEMRTTRSVPATLLGTTLIAAVFLASNMTRLGFGGTYLKFVCAPYIHSGSLFSGLILIPLLARFLHGESDCRRLAAISATLLIALATYSDLSFVPWFAAPVCLGFLIMPTRLPFGSKLGAIFGLAIVGIAAAALDHRLRQTSTGVSDVPPDINHSLDVCQQLLKTSLAQGQWQLWLPVLLAFVMLGRAVVLTCTPRDRAHARQDSLEVSLIFATIASMLVPVLMGIAIHESRLRYFLPVLLLPYVWVLALASRWNTSRREPWLSAASVVFWLGCIMLIPRGLAAINTITKADTLSARLASLGLKAGYGDYWTCKRTMFETNYAVHCLPINVLGKPNKVNYNSRWFVRRGDEGGAILPTFVVTTRLDEKIIRGLFGDPASVTHFNQEKIWLYDKPLPLITPPDASSPNGKIVSQSDFVGIGTAHPDTTLHVARNHPDLVKLQNTSPGGGSWHLQVGGNGWQDGNFMIVNRPSNKHSLLIEPQGRVVVLGDMHVAGTLTTSHPQVSQPKDAAQAAVPAAMQERLDAITSLVEELLGRVGDLEDAAAASP